MPITIASGTFDFINGSGPNSPAQNINFIGAPVGAITMWVRPNHIAGAGQPYIFDAQGYPPTIEIDTGGSPQYRMITYYGGNQVVYQYGLNVGVPVHLAMVWNQTGVVPFQAGYANGNLISSSNYAGDLYNLNGNQSYGIGIDLLFGVNPADLQTSITFEDVCIFVGYCPTQTDVRNLTKRLATPAQIGSGPWMWLTCDGPAGSSAKVFTQGVRNSGTDGTSADFLGNYIAFNGVATGVAIYESTPLTYTPPIFVKDAYVSTNSGMVVFLIGKTNSQEYSYGATVNANPTLNITIGAVTSPLQLQNPIIGSKYPFVIYMMPSSIPHTATITYSAVDQWVTNGSEIIAASTGYLRNLGGQDVFPYAAQDTFLAGFNIAYGGANYGYSSSPIYNYAKRMSGFSLNFDASGKPISAGQVSSVSLLDVSDANLIDSQRGLYPTGVWNISYKDDPVNSSLITFSNFGSTSINSQHTTHDVVSGVLHTVSSAEIFSNPDNSNIAVTLTVSNLTGVFIDDLVISGPGNPIGNTNPLLMDQTLYNQLTTTSGKACPILRGMDYMGTNNCNLIDPSHFLSVNSFDWSTNPVTTILTGTMRPYSLAITPSAYIDTYGWYTPNNINWVYSMGNNSRLVWEFISPTVHNFRTGWTGQLRSPVGPVFNASGNGVINNGIDIDLLFPTIVVTSPSSFLMFGYFTNNVGPGNDISTLTNSVNGTFSWEFDIYHSAPPYETLISYASQLNNCVLHLNIPHLATDAFVVGLAHKIIDNYPDGRKIVVEYTNEHWNSYFLQWQWMATMATVLGLPDLDTYYANRSAQIHNLFDAVFASGNRSNRVTRLFGIQVGNSPTSIVNAAIANGYDIDCFSQAPYLAIVDGGYGSVFYNSPMASVHDLVRHMFWYDNQMRTDATRVLGLLPTYFASKGKNFYSYMYEGGIAAPIGPDPPSGFLLSHDFFYHPEYYRTFKHYNRLMQDYGFSGGTYYALQHGAYAQTPNQENQFYTIRWNSQSCGFGDGSDGKAINKFAMVDGAAHDIQNVSVAQQSWKDYVNNNVAILASTGTAPSQTTPTITWNNPTTITHGTALSATQLNATANTSGIFAYFPTSGVILNAGAQVLSTIFTPYDTVDFTTASKNVNLTVNKITSVITWSTPAAISYGVPLSATQLNATANNSGSFVYSPVAGTIVTSGTHTLSTTFTPLDTTNYTVASTGVNILVNPINSIITWATPASITYGTPLSSTQFNATANTSGSFAYLPVVGTVLTAGTQNLIVTFTPFDTIDYTTSSASVGIVVNKAIPIITWNAPTPIVFGTPLSATQLNATANTSGVFVYNPNFGSILALGVHSLLTTFTPTDLNDYSTMSHSVSISITATGAAPTPTPTPTPLPSPITPIHIFTPSSGSPANIPTGGVLFGGGTLKSNNLINNSLNYPYMGLSNKYNENKATLNTKLGVTTTNPSGTFSVMSKGNYVILTFNHKIAGLQNNILISPARHNTESENLSNDYINTNQINTYGGWYYVNGKPIFYPTFTSDYIGNENLASYSTPGRLTMLAGGKIPSINTYDSKTD